MTNARRTYLISYLALLFLTAATTAVAFVDLGPFSTPIAIVIAGGKALIIALFFMHLIGSAKLIRVFAVAGLIWVAILMSLTAGDFITRGWLPVPGK